MFKLLRISESVRRSIRRPGISS